jgi:S1-C subfamily serine protease
LKISKQFSDPFVGDSRAPVGEDVFVCGFPHGVFEIAGKDTEALFEVSITRGIIGAHRRLEQAEWLQTDAVVHHGNSGGPMLDSSGRWIGIVTLGSNEEAGANFALCAPELKQEFSKWLTVKDE